MRAICVFCGSSVGANALYHEAAARVGRALAERDITLVYGGGRVGLMGLMAEAALAARGRVIGIIPQHLQEREVGHNRLTELHVVTSMHERKALMAEKADAFIALPGGIGTLEEFFEVWTWGQLGLHAKPYGLLNVNGYYGPLVRLIDHMVDQQFLSPTHRDLVLVEEKIELLLDRLARHRPALQDKWLDPRET
jgi:uncharacterized protein (TIGR00730 family)